ncbi:MAG: zinc metalloprotease HtpX [Phormidesmis sp.]
MTTATDLEQLLNVGITAYQRGDYERAIASLLKLAQTASPSYRLKAGMGLARTYIAQQEWAKAKAVCQKLSESSKPSVQKWAQAALLKIESGQASSQTSGKAKGRQPRPLSGFSPLTPPSPEASETSHLSVFHYDYLNGEAHEENSEKTIEESSEKNGSYEWVNAGRLTKGRALGKMRQSQRRTAQVSGAIALWVLLRYALCASVFLINLPLNGADRLLPFWVRQIPIDNGSLNWTITTLLGFVMIAVPWLWDFLLQLTAQRQPFSLSLLRVHSPEAATALGRQCRQRRWPLPTLWKLPTAVPLLFSYGWHPRNARLVVSEGLLTQLAADEIAALVAYECTHWQYGHWPLLSLHGLVLQIFHQLYWQLALWGNRQPLYLRWPTGVMATLSYSIFWLVRLPGLWISRARTYYGDRTATEATGNPNGLARALIKFSFGLAASVERQGYTPTLIESTALLLPVSPDLARYQLHRQILLEQLFAWDSLNPLRHWMSLGDAHPPLGDRLRLIMAYAQHWRLAVEIDLVTPQPKQHKGLSRQDWGQLIRQSTPFFGLMIGAMGGITLWIVGVIAHQLTFFWLDWMYQDSALFQCCSLLGMAIGILLQINHRFPDLSFEMPLSQGFSQLLSKPSLPLSSLPTRLSGSVLGRPGLANWLGQDLLLKTPFGLHKLYFFSAMGPLGNGLGLGIKPAAIRGEPTQVLGWFRRGNQPWLDIDKIRLSNGQLVQAAHPIYLLLLAAIASGLGLWLIIRV